MIKYARELLLHALLEKPSHALELWEVMGVNQTPVFLLHELDEAPEDSLLVIRYIEQEYSDEEVDSLDVAHLVIVVGVSHEYVEQFLASIDAILIPEAQVAQGSVDVPLNLGLGLLILKFA